MRLCEAALERAPGERPAFLDEACAGDEDLRREVESLLDCEIQSEHFMETPPDYIAAGIIAGDQARPLIGRTLGRYRIRSMLGAGGMGEVYRAEDSELGRDVAIKILPEYLSRDPEALSRFKREARAMAALSHPNILHINDFGADQGLSYAVIELLEGETLRSRLNRSALDWREAAKIGLEIAEGLTAAHARGVIHRDLKPENIFLTADGRVTILDFGIARMKRVIPVRNDAPTISQVTVPGSLIGTLNYMSPEQARGEEAEAPSDIFSLGCALYEMVSGRQPFTRETNVETLAAILKDDPPALTGAGNEVPAELDRLIRRCLQKQAEKRPQSARDLATDLRTILSVSGRSSTRLIAQIVAAGILLALAAIASYIFFSRREPPPEPFRTVAALPFRQLDSNDRDKPFEMGLPATLIPKLNNIREIRMLPLESARNLPQDRGPIENGRDLRADLVLAGNIQSDGDAVRVTMQLIRVEDHKQIWTGAYDEKFTQVLTVQDSIANRAVVELTRQLVMTRYTENAEAFDLYQQGRESVDSRQAEQVKQGVIYFEQAIEKDSRFALAYSGLADAYLVLGPMALGAVPPEEAMRKQKEFAIKALEIDNELAEARASLAITKMFYYWEWGEAERELNHAIRLYPKYALARRIYSAYLTSMGRGPQGIEEARIAFELAPSLVTSNTLAGSYYLARQYDKAIDQYLETIKMAPQNYIPHSDLAQVYEQLGKYNEALDELELAEERSYLSPSIVTSRAHIHAMSGRKETALELLESLRQYAQSTPVSPLNFAIIYIGLNEKDKAFEWMDKAYNERSPQLIYLKVEPKFDDLRSDPRFTNLLRRIGLE